MTSSTSNNIVMINPVGTDACKNGSSHRRARSIIREFSLNTSTHGIPGIARSQSIPNRIFWAISTFIFAGAMAYFITESILDFLQYPTQTLVSVIDDSSQAFPAVSICNYSPLRQDLFMKDFLNYTDGLNLTNTTNYTMMEKQSILIQDFFQYKLNRNESMTDYFFTLENMLISCKFNQLDCYKEDFIAFSDARYGNCYTFNAKASQIRNGTVYKLSENGDWGFLELELYVHSQQYVPYWSPAMGMIVQIHDNEQIPLMHWKGHYLIPGRRQRLTFTRKTQYRLPKPYSDCDTKVPYMLQVAFDHFGNASYTYEQYICATVCIQVYIYTKCGCVDSYEWGARYIAVSGTDQIIIAPVCSQDNTCYKVELDRINNDYNVWIQNCPMCVLECKTTDFLAKLSSLAAPMQWLLHDLKPKIESLSVPLSANWSNMWQSEISQNYLALEIVSESARTELLNDTPSISSVDLLSNIGGQTGLWLRISFLSLMEIAEMAYRLIRCKLYKLRKRKFKRSLT
ncbi:unnamed protein product [Adineta steineri]|uniref:Uncharacterized protein n=1 Tax=Adineta steineri TaxID=433720 RepID=A0A814PTR3_9BILA|nr:unnamed protein product [Adineta steineri]CAF1110479.1 unnamed protein product [Adineta steineri]